jgi:hypothetical protein
MAHPRPRFVLGGSPGELPPSPKRPRLVLSAPEVVAAAAAPKLQCFRVARPDRGREHVKVGLPVAAHEELRAGLHGVGDAVGDVRVELLVLRRLARAGRRGRGRGRGRGRKERAREEHHRVQAALLGTAARSWTGLDLIEKSPLLLRRVTL